MASIIIWIKRNRLSNAFRCLSWKRLFGGRRGNFNDLESVQVGSSWHAKIVDASDSYPNRLSSHVDEATPNSLRNIAATVQSDLSASQLPSEDLDEKVDSDAITNPFASTEGGELDLVPEYDIGDFFSANPLSSRMPFASAGAAPVSDAFRGDHDDILAPRYDVIQLQRELPILSTPMDGQFDVDDELPLYDHLVELNPRSRNLGGSRFDQVTI